MTDPMLTHRLAQTAGHEYTDDPLSSIVSVELNVLDYCSRACSFCPHGDPESYPNRAEWKMMPDVALKIAQDLASFDYKGRISLTGYGEPLLHKGLEDIMRIMRRYLSGVIEFNTNGDALTAQRIKSVYDAGATYVYVNAYDGPHQAPAWIEMFDHVGIHSSRYRIRNRWPGPDDQLDMRMNNRGGSLIATEYGHVPLQEPLQKSCAYPAFKAFVDFDGSLLYCSNDWNRSIVIGNVMQTSFTDLWMNDIMKEIRRRVFYGDRNFGSCAYCDVNGLMHSTESMEVLRRHYGWEEQKPEKPSDAPKIPGPNRILQRK